MMRRNLWGLGGLFFGGGGSEWLFPFPTVWQRTWSCTASAMRASGRGGRRGRRRCCRWLCRWPSTGGSHDQLGGHVTSGGERGGHVIIREGSNGWGGSKGWERWPSTGGSRDQSGGHVTSGGGGGHVTIREGSNGWGGVMGWEGK